MGIESDSPFESTAMNLRTINKARVKAQSIVLKRLLSVIALMMISVLAVSCSSSEESALQQGISPTENGTATATVQQNDAGERVVPLAINQQTNARPDLSDSSGDVETTIPEETFVTMLLNGSESEKESARQSFNELINAAIDQFQEASADPVEDDDELARRARIIDRAIRAVRPWQAGEVFLRLQRNSTPPSVNVQIADNIEAILQLIGEVEQAESQLAGNINGDNLSQLRGVKASIGDVLIQTLAFLRDTAEEHRRAGLLESARKYADVPRRLRGFDAQYSDLVEIFNISLQSNTPAALSQTQALISQTQAAIGPDEQGVIEALVNSYIDALLSGDLASINAMYVGGEFSPQEFEAELQGFEGLQLQALGIISTEAISPGEYAVSIEDITLIDTSGNSVVTRNDLHIRNVDGKYMIVFPGP